MSIYTLLLSCFTIICLSGCLTNHYRESYEEHNSSLLSCFAKDKSTSSIVIRPVTTEDNVLDAIEAGYIPIGASTFSNTHCPWVCAVDVAEEVGADLVLIDEQYKSTETRTSVLYLPSYHHAYTSGTVHFSNRAYGNYPAYGTYHGNTFTTSYTSVPVQTAVSVYEQSALFLRKGSFGAFYGAILQQAPQLPDENENAEIPVRVFAVLKGSQAESDGLVRGQRVVSINGKPIRTRQDFSPFANAPMTIRSVETRP